jgi:hypothetical protein
MEGDGGSGTETVLDNIKAIADDKHLTPLLTIFSSSAPPDELVKDIITWFLNSAAVWVNHAGAFLEYIFRILSKRTRLDYHAEAMSEMQFNNFLIESSGISVENGM